MSKEHLGEFEELVLLMILLLKEDAYGVAIRNALKEHANRTVTIGAVHGTVNRLEKKGYLESEFGEATAVRGGKRKRFFKVTPLGKKVLDQVMDTRKQLWDSIPSVAFDFKFG